MMQSYFDWAIAQAKAGRPFWLNVFFRRALPFNAPHGFRIVELTASGAKVRLPDRRKNRNHLKGIHACAMATACEFSSGLGVLERFNMKDYRLIMYRLEVDYHRRAAPGPCVAQASISADLDAQIRSDLSERDDKTSRFSMTSELRDTAGELVATATVHWHVKAWEAVRFGKN
ncbi:MAG: DUF4442 domain-containing protein [Flavobacteriales bacterium]